MNIRIHTLTMFVLTLLLVGCESVRLSELSNEFEATYSEKLAERNLDGITILPSDSVRARFTQISEAATGAADAIAIEEKPRLRIGFRRLAVLSAWQAAAKEEDPVLLLQDKGQRDCMRDNNFERSPRDCLMIDVSGILAAQDATWRRMQLLREQTAPSLPNGKKYPSDSLAGFKTAYDAFDGYLGSLNKIIVEKRSLTAAPEAFWNAVQEQMQRVYCNGQDAAFLYGQTVKDPVQHPISDYPAWESLVTDLKNRASELAITSAIPADELFTVIRCNRLANRSSAQPPQ